MTSEPVPQRLSDADRDAAASMLREHYEAGRLDQTELDERLSGALTARFATDFEPLFADLPEPHPPGLPTPQAWSSALAPYAASAVPSIPGGTEWIGVARTAIWPVAIVLAVLTGNWGLFIAIAIIGSILLKQLTTNRRQPPPWLDQQKPPSLDR